VSSRTKERQLHSLEDYLEPLITSIKKVHRLFPNYALTTTLEIPFASFDNLESVSKRGYSMSDFKNMTLILSTRTNTNAATIMKLILSYGNDGVESYHISKI
jgi:hypothetical protein